MYRIEWKREIPWLVYAGLLLLSPLFVYDRLPEQIPVHWNVHGEVDSYIARSPLSALMFPLIAVGVYLLMLFLPFLDPKREKYELFRGPYRVLRNLLFVFMSLLHVYIVLFSLGYELPANKVVPGLIALLFIAIGNLMGKVRQNWFVGFKFPWTISDEDVWNKTHRLGGKLLVLSGVLGLIGLLLPVVWMAVMLIGTALSSVVATAVYSYVIYKRRHPAGSDHPGPCGIKDLQSIKPLK